MSIEDAKRLQHRRTVKADVLRGPFDPGGQPSLEQKHPLHISLFAWNVRSGLAATKAVLSEPKRYRDYWEWPASRDLLQAAERAGFDGQLQYGMWSGYGGETDWNGASLDWATAAAVSAASTERLDLRTTVHVGFDFHPLLIAKTTAAIDHVSGGRLGVNLVAAVDLVDYAQFGFGKDREAAAIAKGVGRTPEERYAMADEFTTLLKYLWTSDEAVDFEGEYFQAYGAHIDPKPASRPRPLLMNAAGSDLGIDFATRQCDAIFVSPGQAGPGGWEQQARDIKAAAAAHGRTVRICMMCFVVMDETDEKAAETVEWLASEIDVEAVTNQFRRLSGSASASNWGQDGVSDEHLRKFGLGLGGYQVFGSYKTVADTLASIHSAGVDQVALFFWDPARSVEAFGEHVVPLLDERGLRR
ncbi:LLM class flavin-dependent oxidoreductase [Nocardioides sp. AN3]